MIRALGLILGLLPALASAQVPIPDSQTNPITISLRPSRQTGAAPLAVLFDLIGTTSTLTSRPFHELQYSCDFGDSAGGAAWSYGTRTGSRSKNVGYGPVQAHVYESGGTYNLVCTVTHGANTNTAGTTITVTAADSQWSGTSTLCVRQTTGSNFAGCPAGAHQVTDSDFDNVINTRARNGATYKRILFRAGDTFTSSAISAITAHGPGYVGAFGSGAKPVITGATAKIWFGTRDNSNPDFGDWRFVGLNFDGVSRAVGSDVFRAMGPFTRVTILNNEIRQAEIGVHLPTAVLDAINTSRPFTAPIWSEIFVVGNTIEAVSSYGFLGGAASMAFMGNLVNDNDHPAGHLVRTGYCKNCVISNNELGPASSGLRLTVRAFGAFTAGSRTFPAGTAYTENVVVSENKILGTGFSIRGVNDTDDSRIRNVIVESNYLLNNGSAAPILATEAGLLTIRNNLFDMTAAGNYQGVWLSKSRHANIPSDINRYVSIYNNSAYSPTTTSSIFYLVTIMNSSPQDLTIQNNLSYMPALSGTRGAVRGTPGANSKISHNTDGTAISISNPGFVATPAVALTDWRPSNTSSGPVDNGTSVPVWSDFFRAARSGTYDQGAVNP